MSLENMRRVALEARQELLHLYSQVDFLNAERRQNRNRIVALELTLSTAISLLDVYCGKRNADITATMRRVLDDDARNRPRLIVNNGKAQ